MRAADIAKAERGHRAGNDWLIRCPAHDDSKPSCSITDGERGLLLKCHAGCSQQALLAAARARGWLGHQREAERDRLSTSVLRSNFNDGQRVERAIAHWSEAKDAHGTLVETYLGSRALALPPGKDVIRFHPAGPWLDEASGKIVRIQMMIAAMRCILTDRLTAIHRTALSSAGEKIDRRMLGRAAGSVIKLSPDEEVTDGLGIAEGLETALSVFAKGWRPIWATGSAGAIATFPVLPGVEALTIFADADPAGTKAARDCRARWYDAGCECTILLPPRDGEDWNDAMAV